MRDALPRLFGPFAFQANSTTRVFEYPWAFSAVTLAPQTSVIDLGGSLAGFQFVLAKQGAHVINVDPGEDACGRGWPVNDSAIARLNRSFRTDVELRRSTLEEAGIPSDSVDVVYSISTIEHIPAVELPRLMVEITRVLRPGGSCVLTVDLFLNLRPFTKRDWNEYGTNVSPRDLVEWSGLDLASGRRSELLGYPEFDERSVLAHLEDYLIGDYPALAQCFVLRKPTDFRRNSSTC